MLYKLDKYWQGLGHILFPQCCAGCDTVLRYQEQILCTSCLYHLPKTDHHLDPENSTARQLWGKVSCQYAASMLTLSKSSNVQRMIHHLKYSSQPDIGTYLGRMYGHILKGIPWLDSIDIIVPVPIHPKKARARGYNQSDYFAKGLSEVLEIPCCHTLLIRRVHSVSQTRMTRSERYDNVADVFVCTLQEPTQRPTHILLIDDVITTGATLAAAAQVLIKALGCEVSILTIARA